MSERLSSIEHLSQSRLFYYITEICSTVNGVTNRSNLFEISLKKIMELFGANRGSIFVLAENGKELVLETSLGMKVDERSRMVKQMGGSNNQKRKKDNFVGKN